MTIINIVKRVSISHCIKNARARVCV